MQNGLGVFHSDLVKFLVTPIEVNNNHVQAMTDDMEVLFINLDSFAIEKTPDGAFEQTILQEITKAIVSTDDVTAVKVTDNIEYLLKYLTKNLRTLLGVRKSPVEAAMFDIIRASYNHMYIFGKSSDIYVMVSPYLMMHLVNNTDAYTFERKLGPINSCTVTNMYGIKFISNEYIEPNQVFLVDRSSLNLAFINNGEETVVEEMGLNGYYNGIPYRKTYIRLRFKPFIRNKLGVRKIILI